MKDGYTPSYTDYPATVALFTSGDAAMMINGVWEVPTMIDLDNQGKLFNWGAIELPVFFNHPCTYSKTPTPSRSRTMSARRRRPRSTRPCSR